MRDFSCLPRRDVRKIHEAADGICVALSLTPPADESGLPVISQLKCLYMIFPIAFYLTDSKFVRQRMSFRREAIESMVQGLDDSQIEWV